MARPFHVEVVPPPPLTVEETAQKYGVSRAKSKLLKEFAADAVTAADAHFKRNAKRVGSSTARKSAKLSRVSRGKKK